ncbi:MAG: hypothetical protein IJD48_03250 [Clostridia bacterium]|nr:hypothetical protein [bacterium]MBQ3048013.1 hypothetical protein [Clostridia bacterium]
MKKLFISCAALFVFLAVNAPVKAEPVYGFIYKNSTEAGEGLSNVAASKKGSATCTSYFGIVGVGSCGIKDAAKAGNIRTVSYYDYETKNILGFKKVTVNAYGQ